MARLWTKSFTIASVLILSQLGGIHAHAQSAPAPREAVTNQVTVMSRNGGWLVEADNTPLNEILRAISRQTGAQIDLPPRGGERVTGHIGPAPLEEIVDSLLSDHGFNYIIEGWAGPGVPVRVVFLSEIGGSGARQRGRVDAPVEPQLSPSLADPQQGIESRRQMNEWVNERRQMIRQAIVDRTKQL